MRKIQKRIATFVMALTVALGGIATIPASADAATSVPTVRYHVHIQSIGDNQEWKSNGESAGTSGQSKRLEAIKIEVEGNSNLGVEYKTHIQSYGWEKDWKKNGEVSGTSKQSKRLEAIQIKLTGSDASKYDIYYRVHAQSYGWLGWAKNGESAGTANQSKRLEAIQIKIVKKGDYPSEGTIGYSFVDLGKNPSVVANGIVNYTTHVQTYRDQAEVADGSVSGTFGEAKRLEAIKIRLDKSKLDIANLSGGIEYKTHVQSIGWEKTWAQDGAKSGTSGQAKRLEAIQIRLTGEVAQYYDVYYRVHAQTFGWMAWAKNGEAAGTSGYSKRLEGIQIVVVPKGSTAPVNLPIKTSSSYVSKNNEVVEGAITEVKATGLDIGSDMTVKAGSTTALKVVVAPANVTNQRLVYTSSNENVATVDNKGNVTALTDGTTVITATTTDGSNISKSITVCVTSTVDTTGVKVNPATVNMVVGGTQAITTTVEPATATNKAVTYQSMDTSVATVNDSGVITAVGRGTTQVVVTSVANSMVQSAVTVTVTDAVATRVEVKPGASATISISGSNGAAIVSDLDKAVAECKSDLTALEGSDWTVADVNAGNDVYTVQYTNGAIHYYNEEMNEVDHAVVGTRLNNCAVTITIPVSTERVGTLFSTLQTLQDKSGYVANGNSYSYTIKLTNSQTNGSYTLSNLTLSKQYTSFVDGATTYQVYMSENAMYVVGDVTTGGIFKSMADDGIVTLSK